MRRIMLAFLALMLAFSAQVQTQAQAQTPPRRVALVVGNGAYSSNPLKNPPNDAEDVAASLRDAGFEVNLLKNADLTAFEKAVTDFAGKLKGADTGLFYYAGHGVQVDGMNYLIPVSPRIDDAASVKAKAVAVDTVVGRMEISGVRTALVFLDSCRDNPFPGASRSGTRGLAVVQTPRTVNSLIAYATSPGDVAADGDGRNGVFSGAFLEQLRQPGLELSELMRNVRAEVARASGNKQQPRVDDGMKESFYFVSPELLAARAQAALDTSKAEVARLERELADRQARIANTRDAQARQALEVDQQRQQALTVAKRLETENLAREAEKQKKLAQEATAAAAQKAALAAAQSRQQEELGNLAAARRAELEKLAQAAASDNPDILIETVERLEAVLKEVDEQYAQALSRSMAAVNAGWDKQLASLDAQKPEIIETDAEFNARIAKEKATLQSGRQAELASLRSSAETQRFTQTQAMRSQFNDTLATLQNRVWTITGSAAKLSIGEFDRNARTWPFTVSSADPYVPMVPVPVVADLARASDPRAAILALDTAVKAGALAAEIDWGISRDVANKRYAVDVLAVRVLNLTNGEVVASTQPRQRAAYFITGRRNNPTAAVGTLYVSTAVNATKGELFVNGQSLGPLPYRGPIAEGSYSLEVQWSAGNALPFKQVINIAPGATVSLNATTLLIALGKPGPAGGLVFYDKGNSSDGWRYLEAAPTDTHARIQWYNGNYIDIKTGTAIGSGKANTAAIIAVQGSGSYAAMACRNLSIGGFSDWFLPSKDELNLMYQNLKKANLGGFGSGWYWSSSQYYYDSYDACVQRFSDGNQGNFSKFFTYAVRAVRAF
jgi:uncharacterized caspase-like protein